MEWSVIFLIRVLLRGAKDKIREKYRALCLLGKQVEFVVSSKNSTLVVWLQSRLMYNLATVKGGEICGNYRSLVLAQCYCNGHLDSKLNRCLLMDRICHG